MAHAGFVILAAGTTLYWARGFAGEFAVVTGQTQRVERTRALISLDNFAYKISPIMTKSGMVYQPIDYVSQVRVTGKDGIQKRYTLRVNHPIDVDGTLYYQASYGFGMQFLVTHDGRRDDALSPHAARGRLVRSPRHAAQRSLRTFRADDRPSERDPDSRSARQQSGRGSGRLASGEHPGEALLPLGNQSIWATAGGSTETYVLYSGSQYRNDPGVPLVGIGAFVLLAGLIISFYFLRRGSTARRPDRTRAVPRRPAATTVKGYDVFANEFARIAATLRGNGPGGDRITLMHLPLGRTAGLPSR